MTLFEKIIAREIPADIVHEDADTLAFRDITPQAPVHVLIVPKRVIPRVGEAVPGDQAQLGALLLAAGGITTLVAMAPSPVVAPVTVTASPTGQLGDEEATEPSAAPGTPADSDAARDPETTTPEQVP